ncbi:MAG: hypothetical protein QOC68_3489, partial [Solirubrobacteraceae bacterium]|nr:hypothetical protein [Solirubrobacteraceae bacterium]
MKRPIPAPPATTKVHDIPPMMP